MGDSKKLIFLLLSLVSFSDGQTFRLSNFFQNDMVLQMAPKSAVLSGFGDPFAEVTAQYEDKLVTSTVNDIGAWAIVLPPHSQGGPVDFKISQSGSTQTFSFIAWFGDVWFCSGQSNMEMRVEEVYNATEEVTKALSYQNLRLLQVKNNYSLLTELDEVEGVSIPWTAPQTESALKFSAMCLFFGERISDHFNNSRPIGLIESSWGGTRIEAWSSPRVASECNTPANDGQNENSQSALWNGMVAPLTKTTIRGAIWYQGSTNVEWNADYYSCHIKALVNDWRNSFQYGNVPADENNIAFPFGIFQIGPAERGESYAWGYLRWHQTTDDGVLPNANIPEGFFGTTYDLTDHDSPTGDIHFRDKQTACTRLADAAKNLVYGQIDKKKYGPAPLRIELSAPGSILITYDTPLTIGGPDGFVLADRTWSAATFALQDATSVTVQVQPNAVLLTYAFRSSVCEYKRCALYSDDEDRLPAQPWVWNVPAIV